VDTFLTLSEAARFMQVSEEALKQLASSGSIRSIMLATTGAILVNAKDLRSQGGLKDQPEYSQFAGLAGQAVSLSEAGRRYGVLQSTISRWVRDGLIERLGQDGRQVLIDEAQVATASAIYKSTGGRGSWVFKSGKVYTRK
jgi:predicted site-specific integrase-resolvase